jgi:hypothetical protein
MKKGMKKIVQFHLRLCLCETNIYQMAQICRSLCFSLLAACCSSLLVLSNMLQSLLPFWLVFSPIKTELVASWNRLPITPAQQKILPVAVQAALRNGHRRGLWQQQCTQFSFGSAMYYFRPQCETQQVSCSHHSTFMSFSPLLPLYGISPWIML